MTTACAYRNRSGLACRYPGTVSPSTSGRGPWVCREHAVGLSLGEAERVTIRSQMYGILRAGGETELENTLTQDTNRAHNPGPPNRGDSSDGDKQAA